MTWKKSSRSYEINCVEVGARFRPASRCESHTCVEVGRPEGIAVMIRDSKEPDTAPMLAVSPAAWNAFLSHLESPAA